MPGLIIQSSFGDLTVVCSERTSWYYWEKEKGDMQHPPVCGRTEKPGNRSGCPLRVHVCQARPLGGDRGAREEEHAVGSIAEITCFFIFPLRMAGAGCWVSTYKELCFVHIFMMFSGLFS